MIAAMTYLYWNGSPVFSKVYWWDLMKIWFLDLDSSKIKLFFINFEIDPICDGFDWKGNNSQVSMIFSIPVIQLGWGLVLL